MRATPTPFLGRTPMQRWAAMVCLPEQWREEACWEWTGGRSGRGYGQINIHGHTLGAHRYGYERFVGLIPKGKHIDHLCRNHGCVNPSHLEVVTCRENVLRGVGLASHKAAKVDC